MQATPAFQSAVPHDKEDASDISVQSEAEAMLQLAGR
jgi:hypothetical protein